MSEVGDDAGDGFRLLVIRVAFGVLVEAEFGQGLAVEIGDLAALSIFLIVKINLLKAVFCPAHKGKPAVNPVEAVHSAVKIKQLLNLPF